MKSYIASRKDSQGRLFLFWNRFILSVVGFVIIFGFSGPTLFAVASESLVASISATQLTSLANQERLAKGLPALKQNSLLQKAAELKAYDMIKQGYFSHISPTGKSPTYWLGLAGYNYQTAGENLMADILDSSVAMKAWMNSPLHRENILFRDYTEIGTAVVQGVLEGKETVVAVQVFGTPKANARVAETQIKSKPVIVEAAPITKIEKEVKPAVITPKKVVQVRKTTVMKLPEPEVVKDEVLELEQFPRIYYAYDNGRECIIV